VGVDPYIKAIVRRMRKLLRVVCGIPHELLRYATNVDAGAAERPCFDNGCPGTVLRSPLRMSEPAAATTDNE
jgi:hypothetical protein